MLFSLTRMRALDRHALIKSRARLSIWRWRADKKNRVKCAAHNAPSRGLHLRGEEERKGLSFRDPRHSPHSCISFARSYIYTLSLAREHLFSSRFFSLLLARSSRFRYFFNHRLLPSSGRDEFSQFARAEKIQSRRRTWKSCRARTPSRMEEKRRRWRREVGEKAGSLISRAKSS